jgi:hypothetical protein
MDIHVDAVLGLAFFPSRPNDTNMGKQVSVTLDDFEMKRLARFKEENDIDTRAEALRTAIDQGIVRLGYGSRLPARVEQVRKLAKETATVLAYFGVAWLIGSWMFSVEVRAAGAIFLIVSLGLFGFERFVDEYGARVYRFIQKRRT